MKEKLLKIIKHYGIEHQLRKFQEEVFELDEAIINAENNRLIGIIRKPCEKAIDHIAEEISDVLVMLKQFQYYYGIEDEQIEEVMRYKINRQLERLNNKNNNTQ